MNINRLIVIIIVLILATNLMAQETKQQPMKKALILIDIQNDYFEGGKMTLVNAEQASLKAKLILEYFRAQQWPVVYIQHISGSEKASFFTPGTEGVEIHANIKANAHEKLVVKHYPNAFRETDLKDYLLTAGIQDLVVCGMMTHMCVDATTRAAKDYGFNIELISDACATRNLEIDGETIAAADVHLSFLAALNGYYADVKTTANFISTAE